MRREVIEKLISTDNPITSVHYVDVRQSMRNGGGPACLRLRVPLSDADVSDALPGVFLTSALAEKLEQWVAKHYRSSLKFADLGDPHLLHESRKALDELTGLLGLGCVYQFQI